MMQTSRQRRIHASRRTLNVEALEERTLLTGPSGVVVATQMPNNGVLSLLGDAGNNSVLIGPVAGNPNQIRLQGQPFTSINGVSFTDFTLPSVTSIQANLQGGNNNLSIQGFSIPGNLTINNGNAANNVAVSNFSSNTIQIGSANSSSSTVNLSGVRTGLASVTTGGSQDSINLSGVTIGTANINSGTNNDQVAITGGTVGNLTVNSGAPGQAGNSSVNVSGNQIAQANINVSGVTQDNGAANVTISNNTFTSNLNLNVGQSGVSSSYQVNLSNLTFNNNAPSVQNNTSLSINVGNATAPSDTIPASSVSVSGISGVNNATLNTGANLENVSLDGITARSLNINVGDNTNNFTLSNVGVAGPVNTALGNGANNVTLNNIATSVSPIDLALGRPADLNVSFGDNTGTVTATNLNVGRNLNVTAGNGDAMFLLGNNLVGQNLNLLTGTGNTTILLDSVHVLNELFAQTGGGSTSVGARNVTAAFGFIDGGAGSAANNVFWNQGGNQGFAVLNFDNFLVGPVS